MNSVFEFIRHELKRMDMQARIVAAGKVTPQDRSFAKEIIVSQAKNADRFFGQLQTATISGADWLLLKQCPYTRHQLCEGYISIMIARDRGVEIESFSEDMLLGTYEDVLESHELQNPALIELAESAEIMEAYDELDPEQREKLHIYAALNKDKPVWLDMSYEERMDFKLQRFRSKGIEPDSTQIAAIEKGLKVGEHYETQARRTAQRLAGFLMSISMDDFEVPRP